MMILNDVIMSHLLYSLLTLLCFLFIFILSFSVLHLYSLFTAISWVVNLTKFLINSSISSNIIALSQNLLCLSDHCVLTVYQLKQFELMNHIYVLLILNDIVDLVHNIITLYSIFIRYQSADTSDSWQIYENFSQSINLDYFINWSLIKSNFIKIIHCFKKNSNFLLNHLTFLMWTLFQFVDDFDQFNQFDSFKTE